MILTHDEQILAILKRLSNAVKYGIEVMEDNCDCGECGPCKKLKAHNALLRQVEKVSKVSNLTHKDEPYTGLSDQQVRNYIQSPVHCPFCGSAEIEGDGSRETDGNWHSMGVHCDACEAEWEDIYTLNDIRVTQVPITC